MTIYVGILFHNENTTEGMTEMLKKIHSYVPSSGPDVRGKTWYQDVGLVGDQLTVERAVNCMLSMTNAFTSEERLEGMHVEISDWHSEMNFLSVRVSGLVYKTRNK